METYKFELDAEKNVIANEFDFKLQPVTEEYLDEQIEKFDPHNEDDSLKLFMQAKLQNDERIFFLIDASADPQFNKWSMHLFYSAVEYYCQVVYDQESLGTSMVNTAAFYPYGD